MGQVQKQASYWIFASGKLAPKTEYQNAEKQKRNSSSSSSGSGSSSSSSRSSSSSSSNRNRSSSAGVAACCIQTMHTNATLNAVLY